jgi:hypothetical protein
MLVAGAHGPVAWLDLAGTMVLRMDDPGASQNLHLHGWRYTQLDSHAWTRIGATLQRAEARLSVGYVAGWVDDGDPARGKLELAGAAAARRAGAVHPSPGIRYVAADGSVNDYMAQYRKLLELQHRGLVGIEMHGFTHMHAALDRWAHADDRYDALAWYREFSADAAAARAVTTGEGGPLAEAAAALRRHFGATPTTLIFPGEAFTAASLAAALDLGIELIGSYYLALRRGGGSAGLSTSAHRISTSRMPPGWMPSCRRSATFMTVTSRSRGRNGSPINSRDGWRPGSGASSITVSWRWRWPDRSR